jgi:hypothetical protein
MSATEGEYMSALYAACQGLWLCRLLIKLGLELEDILTPFYLDNHGAMDLLKEACHHQHTKHIDIHHHFVHERVKDGTFEVVSCPTDLIVMDGLTKPCDTFSKMVDALSLIPY